MDNNTNENDWSNVNTSTGDNVTNMNDGNNVNTNVNTGNEVNAEVGVVFLPVASYQRAHVNTNTNTENPVDNVPYILTGQRSPNAERLLDYNNNVH